jgi:decaprenyl-phosphate phosphoribosyltransferase
VNAYIKALRPKQWPKNLLVFAAPGAAAIVNDRGPLARSLGAFAAFCCVSSATYLLNDSRDVESDRLHPTKRNRPIAAGLVKVSTAMALAVALVIVGGALAFAAGGWRLAVVLGIYVATTTSYSLWLKRVAVVDLVLVSSGFVLRAIAGAVAVRVPLSNWFLICVSFTSLFIVTGKRYAELNELNELNSHGGVRPADIRASLDQYTPNFLRLVLGAALSGTMLSYCLWAFEKENEARYRLPLYLVSVIPMVSGILRYLLLLDRGRGAAPEELFWRDRTLQVLGVVWVAIFAWGVYAG